MTENPIQQAITATRRAVANRVLQMLSSPQCEQDGHIFDPFEPTMPCKRAGCKVFYEDTLLGINKKESK